MINCNIKTVDWFALLIAWMVSDLINAQSHIKGIVFSSNLPIKEVNAEIIMLPFKPLTDL